MKTIAIIGGGPAGYIAAVTAAQNDAKVMLIEEKELGGACFNDGCIPAKSLLKSAETIQTVQQAQYFGVDVPIDEVKVNWNKVQDYKNKVVKQLVQDIGELMKKNKVQVIKGKATFLTSQTLHIIGTDHEEVVTVDQVIIATGSESNELPSAPFDGNWVIDSSKAQELPYLPTSILIIGGGVIGCEYASIYSRLGTKVTFLDRSNQLLKGEDADLATELQKQLERDGVVVHSLSEVKQLNVKERKVVFGNETVTKTEYPDFVLVSIGRKPRIDGLNLDKIGVQYSSRGIEVNESMQTNIPHIYACGDVSGGMKLAHVAFHEGRVAALHACGEEAKVNYQAVPRCVYTSPEIASVGLTEEQARNEYGFIRVGESLFCDNAKASIYNERLGKVKVIVEPQSDKIVGFSIVGPRATELIGQGTIMIHAGLTAGMLEDSIAAHPTLSEAVQKALFAAKGQAVYA